MTYARNEITFWDEVQNVPEYQFSTGRPVGSRNMLLYVADGIFKTQAEIDEAREKGLLYSDNTVPGDIRFKDMNGDGKIDGLDRIRPEKNQEPRFVAGLTLTAKWKGFDLMMLWQGATGAEVYIETWSGLVGYFLKRDCDKRWTPENQNAKYPRLSSQSNANNYQANTVWLADRSFLKLRNAEVYYRFPEEWMKKTKILGSAKLYVRGTDLFCSDHIDVTDPECYGVATPLNKSVVVGVTIGF